jgi:hypothetical protein
MGVTYAGAWIAGYELSPEMATSRFFEIAAQVIPLLILVLSVEVRFFELDRMPRSDRPAVRTVLRGVAGTFSAGGTGHPPPDVLEAAMELWGRLVFPLGLLVALVVGEVSALNVVADASAPDANPGTVYGALFAGLAAIVLIAVATPPARGTER